MSKISSLRQQLISEVGRNLVELDSGSVIPGKWGIPDLEMDYRLILAIKEWVNQIPIWIKKFNEDAQKTAEVKYREFIKTKPYWKVTKENYLSCPSYDLRNVTWVDAQRKEHVESIRVAIAINSGYRPALFGVKGDKNGYVDLRDPRGHWSGLSIDVGLKETAEWLWGGNAFDVSGLENRLENRSYSTLKSEYKRILVKSAHDAGLDRVFLSKGEWWHFSFDDKRARQNSYIWHKYYEEGNNGIRPKARIRHLRWDLATILGIV